MHELLTRFLEEVRGSWRFRWRGLLVAWFVAVAGCLMVYSLPNEYTSTAKVHVDTQSLLRPLLHGLAVEPNLDMRVQLMTTTLLSDRNLETIAQKAGLVSPAQSPEQQQAVLQKLKSEIVLHRLGYDLYYISYTNPSPRIAQDIVRVVLNILMETTLGKGQQDSKIARRFLQTQVSHYGEKLQMDEARLAKFRRDHLGLVPTEGGSDYFKRLNAAEQQLSDLQGQLTTAKEQRSALISEINSMKRGEDTGSAPNTRQLEIDSQIQSVQNKLNKLQLNYTNKYPDVIALKRSLKRLRVERAQAAKLGPGSQSVSDLSVNPVFQKLEILLNATGVTIGTLEPKIAQQSGTVANLKAKAGELTTVQAKLADLTRDYNVTKKQYQMLLARLDSARLSGDVEHSGAQVKFQVIDPPNLPMIASGPFRVLLLVVVSVASLLGGCAFAFFLHLVKPVFVNRSVLATITGRPVLGSVSMVMSRPQLRKARLRVYEFASALVMLVVVLGGAIVLSQPGARLVQTFVQRISL